MTADTALAERAWTLLETTRGIEPHRLAYVRYMSTLGRAGNLDKMLEVLATFQTRGFELDLVLITELIKFCGIAGDVDQAMKIYDTMLELGLKPDNELNQVLIKSCGIDPVSVMWNATD